MRPRRRTRMHLSFVAHSPLHVGAGGGTIGPDQILAVDTAGNHIVPGTSLAGALRSRYAATRPESTVEALFGFVGRDGSGHASRVAIGDGALQLPAHAGPQALTSVAIDRISSTAADRYLHDRVVLPAGTRLTTMVEVDDVEVDDHGHGVRATEILELLAGIRQVGDKGSRSPLRLGAATTRGLGEMELDVAASTIEDLDLTSSDVLEHLYGQPAPRPLADRLPERAADGTTVRVEVAFTPRGPLMVRGDHATTYKAVPRFVFRDGRWTPVLPGSSIKGVLRQAAERIVATVLDRDVVDPVAADDPRLLLEQHDLPLVDRLFGSVKRTVDAADGVGRRGALYVTDVHATSAEHRISDGDLADLLDNTLPAPAGFQRAVHVALDRFTGGAAEHLLYDTLEPHGVSWEPITIEVDPRRLGGGSEMLESSAALGLLLLVIGELQAGMHAFGAFAERGHGDIVVQQVTVTGSLDHDGSDAAGQAAPAVPDGWEIDPALWSAAAAGWTAWVEREVG